MVARRPGMGAAALRGTLAGWPWERLWRLAGRVSGGTLWGGSEAVWCDGGAARRQGSRADRARRRHEHGRKVQVREGES